MSKVTNFFKSILPILVMVLLQAAIMLVVGIVYAATSAFTVANVLGGIFGTSDVVGDANLINFLYGIAALILFGIWYRHSFILPFKTKKKGEDPSGFSFRVILGILLLGIGLYYVTSLVVDVIGALRPTWVANYGAMVESAGYTNPSILVILYVVILSPLIEETIFRGLTYRYARGAIPFWPANIWQALLFGLMHFNLVQGIYAFVMGLFLGFIVHRGRGIKYSILVHIVFNVIGLFFYGLIERTLEFHYIPVMACGLAVTALALWMFSSYFKTPKTQKSGSRSQK